jgi:hypothetical protein
VLGEGRRELEAELTELRCALTRTEGEVEGERARGQLLSQQIDLIYERLSDFCLGGGLGGASAVMLAEVLVSTAPVGSLASLCSRAATRIHVNRRWLTLIHGAHGCGWGDVGCLTGAGRGITQPTCAGVCGLRCALGTGN